VARHADDEEMNKGLKGVIRWDDPIAAYMMKKQEEEGGGGGGGGRATGRSVTEGDGDGRGGTGRKVYQGAAPLNRYGIKPGWRWDGAWIGAMDLKKSTSGRWMNESRCRCSLQFRLWGSILDIISTLSPAQLAFLWLRDV
jgi:Pre-mRNA-splicing factor of RES complex